MSCASTEITIKMNCVEDANKAVSIMKEIASKRTPDYPNEISKFLDDIVIDDTTVKVEESYSLMSNTFCELIYEIMRIIAKYNFGPITMDAWYDSYDSGYEASFSGRVYKNGKFKLSFSEHE